MGTVWVNVWEQVLEGTSEPLHDFGHDKEEIAERLELCERAHNLGLHVLVGCEPHEDGLWVVNWPGYVKLCERQWVEAPEWMRPSLAMMTGPDGKSLANTRIGESVEIAEGWAAIRACLEAKAIEAETQTPQNPLPRKPTHP